VLAVLFFFLIGVYSYWIKCLAGTTQRLIELVESRPCLWDKTSEEFKDRELKSKLRLEVCSFLEPNFLQLDRKEQMKVGKYYKLILLCLKIFYKDRVPRYL